MRQVWAIMNKDLLLERRTKANLNALIVLAVLIPVIISFALGPSPTRLRAVAGGVLWVAFAFAGVLAFGRAYQIESENRAFEGMLLAGGKPVSIYLGKLLATLIIMVIVEAVVFVVIGILYNLALLTVIPGLAGIAVLATIGLTSVGILYGRLTMSMRAREVMLPLLALPVVLPVLLAAVSGSTLVLHSSGAGILQWIELLVIFDAIFVTVGILTFETLCEE